MGFGYLNRKLKEYLSNLSELEDFDIEEYKKFINMTFLNAIKINDVDYSKEIDAPKEYIDIKDSINLVIDFITMLDPNLYTKFEEAYKNGIIHLTSLDSLKNIKKTKDNYYLFQCLCGVVDGNYVINVVTENTILDSFALVHEFMHYANQTSPTSKSNSWEVFTEGYSNYFEILFYKFLQDKGELIKSESKKYMDALKYSQISHACIYVEQYIPLDIYLNLGKVNYLTISKYFLNKEDKKEFYKLFLQYCKYTIQFFKDMNKNLGAYLNDGMYVNGCMLSEILLEKDEFEEIYQDYLKLDETVLDYYLEKYDIGNVKTLKKVFEV